MKRIKKLQVHTFLYYLGRGRETMLVITETREEAERIFYTWSPTGHSESNVYCGFKYALIDVTHLSNEMKGYLDG